MSVRYKSSTIITLDVEPPVDDGGEPIIAYHVYYDQGKVLEFQTGMYIRTLGIAHTTLSPRRYQ